MKQVSEGVILEIGLESNHYIVRICNEQAFLSRVALGREGVGIINDCHVYTSFVMPWAIISHRLTTEGFAGHNSTPYLFAWASGAEPGLPALGTSRLPRNITAVFCRTSYHSQNVAATFEMPSGKVISVD